MASLTPEPYVDVLVKTCDGCLQVFHGYQHVLDHVVLFIEFSNGLPLGELQQRDLRRNHPSKQAAEQWVVAERNNILEKKHKHTQTGKNTRSSHKTITSNDTIVILLKRGYYDKHNASTHFKIQKVLKKRLGLVNK